jgi:putative membrane protein
MTALRSKVVMLSMTLLTASPAWCLSETRQLETAGWTWPPLIVIPLFLTAIVYSLGMMKMLKRAKPSSFRRRSIICFALGWISLVIALDSPLHEIGEQLFWVHMTQHEILMLISAPLLVLGEPLFPFLWAMPNSLRDRVAAVSRSAPFAKVWGAISAPLSAWLFSGFALWIWHFPWLFDQTLHSDWIHAAQHTTFLLSGLLFWWPLLGHRQALGGGAAVAYVFTTAIHTSVLGALLTFAPRPWFSSYLATAPAWGLTALEDQQLGGLIMWIPAGTLLLVVALLLLVRWMNESQRRWQYTRMAELARSSKGSIT